MLESSLLKGIPEWINHRNIEIEEYIKNMNIFDNYNTTIGKENYTDNYELNIKNKSNDDDDDYDDDEDIYYI